VTVKWWFGPTGSGKSKTASILWPEAYMKMPTNKWWDGYQGEQFVIFDDFRPHAELPFDQMLRILDRYRLNVEAKSQTSFPLSATNFLITTCSRPELLWEGKTQEKINQLLRRITEIVEFKGDGEQVILKSLDTNVVYVPLVPTPIASGFVPPAPRATIQTGSSDYIARARRGDIVVDYNNASVWL